jgi:hypothetical protein
LLRSLQAFATIRRPVEIFDCSGRASILELDTLTRWDFLRNCFANLHLMVE